MRKNTRNKCKNLRKITSKWEPKWTQNGPRQEPKSSLGASKVIPGRRGLPSGAMGAPRARFGDPRAPFSVRFWGENAPTSWQTAPSWTQHLIQSGCSILLGNNSNNNNHNNSNNNNNNTTKTTTAATTTTATTTTTTTKTITTTTAKNRTGKTKQER